MDLALLTGTDLLVLIPGSATLLLKPRSMVWSGIKVTTDVIAEKLMGCGPL
jgi:hypothetical protein